MLGFAVGTGNIWRFPRIVTTNGGDSFLIPWIGKLSRQGTVGSFMSLMGGRFAWMGSFVAVTIIFYYSVVAGWCIRHFL